MLKHRSIGPFFKYQAPASKRMEPNHYFETHLNYNKPELQMSSFDSIEVMIYGKGRNSRFLP
uniref:Uncharacterized protein n=1 Tax=Solanum tuberosum TaxID=4113 RepID=M1BEN7_SOLTU